MDTDYATRVAKAADYIRSRTPVETTLGIILGSGLSGVADSFEGLDIPYKDIPGFPVSTVAGHKGLLRIGKKAVIMVGRFHYYEGYSLKDVVFPLFVWKNLGIKKLIITNAAGGIASGLHPADLVLIRDHINLLGNNPFIGSNDSGIGPRFFDMTQVWDHEMRASAQDTIKKILPQRYPLREGVYAALSGPSYETPAEIRMLQVLGADLVGMSTVPEALAASYLGIKALGISCVTNLGAGLSKGPLNHEEVVEVGKQVDGDMRLFVKAVADQL